MRLFRGLLLLIHIVVILLLLGTYLNAFIPPKTLSALNLLSLGFPVLLCVHAVLLLLWLVIQRKTALIILLTTLLFIQPVRRWLNFSIGKTAGHLTVLSMNGKNNVFGEDQIKAYLVQQQPDVMMLQELALQDLKGYEVKSDAVVTIASRHKIRDYKVLNTGGENSLQMYADIEINNRIIRFVNIYLEPFYFDKALVKPSDDASVNKGKAGKVLRKLLHTFRVHQEQVDQVADVIRDSPYPVIVSGDFNSVPNSYEYYKISNGLTDVFLSVGRGLGTTFHDYKFPLRIDYFFCSKSIEPQTFQIDRNVKISDHFPIKASFNLK